MVKTNLETLWDEFIVNIEDGFDCGRKLPKCLHQSAVETVSRKLVEWQQELDIVPGISLDIKSPLTFQENVSYTSITSKLCGEEDDHDTKKRTDGDVGEKGLVASIHDLVDDPLDSVHTDTNMFLENDEDTDCYMSDGETVHDMPNITVSTPVLKLELERLEANDVVPTTTTKSRGQSPPKRRSSPNKTKRRKKTSGAFAEEETSSEKDDTTSSDIQKDVDFEVTSKRKTKKSPKKRKAKPSNPKPKKPKVAKPSVPKVKKPNGRPRKLGFEICAEKKYFCDQCGAGYTAEQNLKRHLIIHQKGPLKCDQCDKVYHSLPGFTTHMRMHQNAYTCPFCDMKFGCKTWQERHVRQVHTKEKPFLCDICGDAFATKNRMSRHRICHDRVKAHFCDLCDFSTHASECYRAHIRNMHTDVEEFVCNICGSKYKYKNSYVDHMKRHKAEKPFKCSKCDYRAISEVVLRKHDKTSHSEPKFVCDICNKKFATRDHVKRHKVIHTGEKEFKCGICDYACNVPSNLRKHWKNVHNHTPPLVRNKVKVISGQNPSNPSGNQNIAPVMDNIGEETAVASKIISEETVETTIPADHYLVTHTTVDSVQNATVIGGLTTTVDTSQVDLQFDQSNYHERSVGFDCL